MKETRQKSYKLHLTHLAIQRKNFWWIRLENFMHNVTTTLKNTNLNFSFDLGDLEIYNGNLVIKCIGKDIETIQKTLRIQSKNMNIPFDPIT